MFCYCFVIVSPQNYRYWAELSWYLVLYCYCMFGFCIWTRPKGLLDLKVRDKKLLSNLEMLWIWFWNFIIQCSSVQTKNIGFKNDKWFRQRTELTLQENVGLVTLDNFKNGCDGGREGGRDRATSWDPYLNELYPWSYIYHVFSI